MTLGAGLHYRRLWPFNNIAKGLFSRQTLANLIGARSDVIGLPAVLPTLLGY